MPILKGDAALSESMMNVVSLILSFVLIILVARGIFGQSSDTTYESTFVPVARDIASTIDRTAALAGSQQVYLELPEGMNVNVTVDNKLVTVIYDKGQVTKTFSGLIHSGPYSFQNPKDFCFVRNRDDRRITIIEGKCTCKMSDGKCDPACLLEYKCDPDCMSETADNFCSGYCSKSGDGVCDSDCYTGDKDMVCDSDCPKADTEDGICDPDCNNTKSTICDIDCFKKYNGSAGFGGICNPACKPIDSNGDNMEDNADGICYTGCAEKMIGVVIKLPKDGACDLDCEKNNSICDPDCRNDTDCEDRCALVGEDCSNIPCCQQEGPEACCPGTMVCGDASDPNKPACCGNGKCEVAPYIKDMLSGNSEATMELPSFSAKDSSVHWENYYTCKEDCQAYNIGENDPAYKSPDGTHVHTGDLVCDATQDSICDVADCPVAKGYGVGIWTNAGAKDGYRYCDPDCSLHPGCPYKESRDQSRADGICLATTDKVCDPDCASNYTLCDSDCCSFNSDAACPTSPACYCPVRVNMSSNFDKSPSFYDTNTANWQNDKVYWTPEVIEVCSDAAIKFLDRRGWDIKQVEKDLLSGDPGGFAFDGSRYATIRNSQGKCTPAEEGSFIQTATKTLEANEKYNLTDNQCCTDVCGRCENTKYVGPMCDGVGFCGDHSVAMLSILRTLGVPAYDVYAGFSSSANPQFRHAYVIYFCDTALPENLNLAACKGNENKWLRFDATHHLIEPFEGTQWCQHFCIAYNDYGAFAQVDAGRYGFGGAYNSTVGYAFPMRGMGGNAASGSLNNPRGLNCQTDISCKLNYDNPKGLCQALGLEKCWTV